MRARGEVDWSCAYQIPDDAICSVPFTFSHEESKGFLVHAFEFTVAKPKSIDGSDDGECA